MNTFIASNFIIQDGLIIGKIQDLENKVQRDLDYGYSGEKIDDQLKEINILENILNKLTEVELTQ